MSGLTRPIRFVLNGSNPSWYLKAVTIRGAEVTDVPFDSGLAGGAFEDAEIAIATTGATIAGRVIDDRGVPAEDYTLLAFSRERRTWFSHSRHKVRLHGCPLPAAACPPTS